MSEMGSDPKVRTSDDHPATPQHSDVRWEKRDISVLGVLLVGVGTCVFGALLLFFIHLMFRQEARMFAEKKASHFPLAPHPSEQLPPEPRLEPIDRLEKIESSNVFDRLIKKEHELHSYGAKSDDGFVRVPIERAIQHVAGTLPAREQPKQEDHRGNGLVNAGETNSGRMFGKERH